MPDRVSVSIDAGVADVRLNRPEKMNALDPAMFAALTETGRNLATDASLRAVVLSGEGRAFCAGLDVSTFGAMASTDRGAGSSLFEQGDESPANFAQRAAWIWQEVPVPVIAAVHGVCFGGGIQIALAADIRCVAPDAKLSIMEVKWGLIPDMSGTQTLRHLVRLDVAKELTFTGRIFSGEEAGRLGLATRISETPRESAFEIAREIASKSPDAIRAGKRLLNTTVSSDLEEGLRLEAKLQASLIGGRNQIESVQSNLEKRAPKFSDPS